MTYRPYILVPCPAKITIRVVQYECISREVSCAVVYYRNTHSQVNVMNTFRDHLLELHERGTAEFYISSNQT